VSITTRLRIAPFCLLAALCMGSSLAGETVQATVLSDSGDRVVLQYTFGQYRSEMVEIKGQEYLDISFPSEPRWMEKGTPALPYVNRSIIIPDNARMEVQVLTADYYETEAAIAPSKGNLYRTVDCHTSLVKPTALMRSSPAGWRHSAAHTSCAIIADSRCRSIRSSTTR